MTRDQRFQKNPDIVSREIVGEMILVPIRQNVGDLESIYTLNGTASMAWNLLDGQRSLAEISTLVASEYEMPCEQVEADLLELFEQLVAIQAVQEA